MNDAHGILYLSGKDVETICQTLDAVSIMRDVFELHGKGETVVPDEAYLSWANERGEIVRSLNMPGHVGGSYQIAGTKIINSNPENPARGLPRASGLTLLYDNISTRVLCVMQGGCLSSFRTAAVTVLAAKFLGSGDATAVAIVGAGALARAHIELFAKTFPLLGQILLFDINTERALTLQRDFAPFLESYGIVLKCLKSAEEGVREAQIIVPVTTTTEGYIRFEWLQAGSLLVNVSLDDPLPEVILRADKVIVDDWNLIKKDSRRLLGRMYRQGQLTDPGDPMKQNISRGDIVELGEVVLGKKDGRVARDEIIVMNPFGLSIEDVALGSEVYREAQKHGMGLWLGP